MKAVAVLLLLLAGCAHAPAPVIDVDAVNAYELCKAKCSLKGKIVVAACEDATHYRCLCEPDNT